MKLPREAPEVRAFTMAALAADRGVVCGLGGATE
jgi:hypothetical protein